MYGWRIEPWPVSAHEALPAAACADFSAAYSAGRLLLALGLRPTAVLGAGPGEYVAACLAGVLSLPDALRLVARRAALLPEEGPTAVAAVVRGGVVAVEAALAQVQSVGDVRVAAIISSDAVRVVGERASSGSCAVCNPTLFGVWYGAGFLLTQKSPFPWGGWVSGQTTGEGVPGQRPGFGHRTHFVL